MVVGPDQALADGIVDYLEGQGIPPSAHEGGRARGMVEGFLERGDEGEGIPTARYEVFEALEPAISS